MTNFSIRDAITSDDEAVLSFWRSAVATVRASGARRIHALVESDHPLSVAFWQSVGHEAVPRIHPYMSHLPPGDQP